MKKSQTLEEMIEEAKINKENFADLDYTLHFIKKVYEAGGKMGEIEHDECVCSCHFPPYADKIPCDNCKFKIQKP